VGTGFLFFVKSGVSFLIGVLATATRTDYGGGSFDRRRVSGQTSVFKGFPGCKYCKLGTTIQQRQLISRKMPFGVMVWNDRAGRNSCALTKRP
jgi:hypothetical protein